MKFIETNKEKGENSDIRRRRIQLYLTIPH